MELPQFLEQIRSNNADVRYRAWRAAGPMGAAAVEPLADLMASPDRGVAKAAGEALQTIVHHAARPTASDEARAVATALLKVAAASRPRPVRADALHGLGFVGDDRAVLGLAKLLSDPEVRDDARMALERIPGRASLRALERARDAAPDDFRPHLEQSIRNRGLTRATVGIKASR
jgi:HEAT repeat protein